MIILFVIVDRATEMVIVMMSTIVNIAIGMEKIVVGMEPQVVVVDPAWVRLAQIG